jgi:hypothetical protein
VAEQQNPNCLPSHAWNQFPFHGLLGDQAHGPSRLPFRRLAADHGNDPLFLGCVQQLLGTAALTLIQGLLQPSLLITLCNPPNRLGRQMNDSRHLRSRPPQRQLFQGNGPQNHPHLLNASAKQALKFFVVFGRDLNFNGVP